MIAAFPDGYPDELLASIIARYRAWSGIYSWKQLASELLDGSTAIMDLPAHLGALVRALPPDCVHTADEFIDAHTLLPYYAPFLPPSRERRVRRMMLSDSGDGIAVVVGVVASGVARPAVLRYCPACVRADVAQFGEPYWHRVHQLPGVLVCERHDVQLESGGTRVVDPYNRYVYELIPDSARTQVARKGTELPHSDVLSSIASSSATLLNWRGQPPGLNALRERYFNILQQQGYATPAGRIRMSSLVESFVPAVGGKDLLSSIGGDLAPSQDNWLARLVRKPRVAQHPLHHLLLLHFLGVDILTFLANDRTAVASQRTASPVRVEVGTLLSCTLQLAPLTAESKPHGSGQGKVRSSELRRHRRAWLDLASQNPSVGRTALRRRASGLYTWLYRHDREWLLAQVPAPRRVQGRRLIDWSERDRALARAVERQAELLTSTPGRPVRMTRELLARRTGHSSLIRAHRTQLPLTHEALARATEPRYAWVERRLAWARDRVPPDAAESVLYREARVRPSTTVKRGT